MAIIVRYNSGDRGTLGAAAAAPWEYDVSVDVEQLTRKELAEVRKDPRTRHAAEGVRIKLIAPVASAVESLDPDWALEAIGCLQSPWSGAGTVVAVLDSGIDPVHPVFRGLKLVEEDFTKEGNGDRHGHGTHCAGTIFGRDVASRRIGVAPGIEAALIYKVIDAKGRGSTESLAKAIVRATECGAHLISMSVAFDFKATVSQLIEDGYPESLAPAVALEDYRANIGLFEGLSHYLERQIDGGPLVIAAAGNDSQRNVDPRFRVIASPPADARGFIAVGALELFQEHGTAELRVASFSNTKVEIVAPGVNIVSANLGGGLMSMSGTSMAAPHITGAAALWREAMKTRFEKVRSKALWSKIGGSARLTGHAELEDIGCGLIQCPLKI